MERVPKKLKRAILEAFEVASMLKAFEVARISSFCYYCSCLIKFVSYFDLVVSLVWLDLLSTLICMKEQFIGMFNI